MLLAAPATASSAPRRSLPAASRRPMRPQAQRRTISERSAVRRLQAAACARNERSAAGSANARSSCRVVAASRAEVRKCGSAEVGEDGGGGTTRDAHAAAGSAARCLPRGRLASRLARTRGRGRRSGGKLGWPVATRTALSAEALVNWFTDQAKAVSKGGAAGRGFTAPLASAGDALHGLTSTRGLLWEACMRVGSREILAPLS